MPFFIRVKPDPPKEFVFKSDSTFSEPHTFVSIGGVASSRAKKGKCFNWTYNDQKMLNIRSPYFSKGPNTDFLAAIGDIWHKANYDDEKPRHRALYNIVTTCLEMGKNVILSAVSHGSVIVHAILLKLKIDGVRLDNLKAVITIGSPQYIPWGVLPVIPNRSGSGKLVSRIVNLYNVDDIWLNNEFNNRLFKLFMPLKVPKLKIVRNMDEALTTKFTGFNGNEVVHGDFKDGLVFVKFDYETDFGHRSYQEASDKQYVFGLACHTSHRNMEAVLPASITQHIHYVGESKDCPPEITRLFGGGATNKKQSIVYLPTKKHYSVRLDKQKRKYITMNKQKVYISDIRGKYRYQRT